MSTKEDAGADIRLEKFSQVCLCAGQEEKPRWNWTVNLLTTDFYPTLEFTSLVSPWRRRKNIREQTWKWGRSSISSWGRCRRAPGRMFVHPPIIVCRTICWAFEVRERQSTYNQSTVIVWHPRPRAHPVNIRVSWPVALIGYPLTGPTHYW